MAVRDRIVELRRVPASDLIPNRSNWRRHPAHQAKALAAVLEQVGYAGALIARETPEGLELIDGHLRAETTPDQEVPVLVLDVDEDEAALILATLDPLAAMAETDQDALWKLLEAVAIPDDDLARVLEGLTGQAGVPVGLTDPDDVPSPPAKPKTKLGDLWLLGEHRLLCGDATDTDAVTRLLDGEQPVLMATDPPYGVELDQGWRDRIGINRLGRAQTDRIVGDDSARWTEAYRLADATVSFVWHAGIHAGEVAADLIEAGYEIRQQIVWVKPMAPLSRAYYHWKHEPCWFAVRKGRTVPWRVGRDQTTVWEAASPKHIMSGSDEPKLDHPTQKPVALFERPIENHTQSGEAVYDPFVGSGTAIVAAERLGRTCYAMEIDPVYVDVSVKRWEDFTGKKAERAKAVA